MVMSALDLADAFVDRTGGVADLQTGVPQAIEDRFRDRLAPSGLLVGQQEQQIDVGAGRLQAAAIAASGDHRHVLGLGRILRRIEMFDGKLEKNADDLVFHLAQPLGAAAAVTILEQLLLSLGAAVVERGPQPLRQRRAQFALAAGMRLGECFQVSGNGAGVDQFGRTPGWGCRARVAVVLRRAGVHGSFGIADEGREVTARQQRYSCQGAFRAFYKKISSL